MTTEYPLPERVVERINRIEQRAEGKLNRYLRELPDGYPEPVQRYLTELGEAVVAAIANRSRTEAIRQHHISPETIEAARLATVHYNKITARQRRDRKVYAEQFAASAPMMVQTPGAPVSTDEVIDTTVPELPDHQRLTPGTPITEKRMLAHMTRAEKAYLDAHTAYSTYVDELKAPLNEHQTEKLLAKLDADLEQAKIVRTRYAATNEKASDALAFVYNLRAEIRTAHAKCRTPAAFHAPRWKARASDAQTRRLNTLKARVDETYQHRYKLERQYERQKDSAQGFREPKLISLKEIKPKSTRTGGRAPKYKMTAEDRRTGIQGNKRVKNAQREWAALLMWPSDPEDAAAGRRLMDLSNRHRRTDPSYRSGDKFYTLQMSLHVLVDLIRYLHKDVPSKTYMAAFNQAKVNWVAAGAVKHALQAKYQPEMWRTLDPCLLQCVVMIPGTKRWVVSERHVDRLLAGLAEAKFPHRVIEFPGFPMFTDHNKFRTNRKAKPLRKMRIAKPGVALAHTGDGNPTLAGAREFHLIDALNEGKASLRYSPTEEQFEAHRADVERNLRNVIKRQEEANARRKAEKIIEPEPEPVPVWVKLAARTDAPALPPAEYLTPEPRTA